MIALLGQVSIYFSGSTLRLIDIQVQPYAVTWNVYYINYLTFKRDGRTLH